MYRFVIVLGSEICRFFDVFDGAKAWSS
uniref:Uncharacterized protein n=1 Tax=Arundo donax TaxID=35708 RepID=A0A0A8ZVP9_ARUDO